MTENNEFIVFWVFWGFFSDVGTHKDLLVDIFGRSKIFK